ncbi:MAG: tetraacyldisaccharide 4'-kinase, partial [Elusimicrobia bacterium CG08_land_8_20_14_0_20_59_10]
GTGKTSTVVAMARELARAGWKPAILIRGYKRSAPAGKVTVMAEGRLFDPHEAGDEALMLYRMLEKNRVPVLVCADRFASGTIAVSELGADLLLLDDGFQHFALERDLDIVIVNATAPFMGEWVLPFGNLRESPKAVKRAGAVIISHCEEAAPGAVDALRAGIHKFNPSAEILESCHTPEFFLDPAAEKTMGLDSFVKKRAAALSAIGDPASFEAALARLKIDLKQIWRYPDHHFFTSLELSSARQAAQGMPIITTFKDFVRFPPDWPRLLGGELFILSIRMTFQKDGWQKLVKLVSCVKKGNP